MLFVQVISINLDTLKKMTLTTLKVLRGYHGMEIIGKYLYVIGGNDWDQYFNSVERLVHFKNIINETIFIDTFYITLDWI